ncbi:MAG TPA: protein kinase, partial [Kofleriaceae bacterium]|nr:protein kinase [Kofleriaceae bacterium]
MTYARGHPHGNLGRYELVARLATGGMGEIFLARVEGLAGFEKLFVVKRIVPHLADDIRFRTMLIDEARLAAKMSHPNVCQVYELGETDGQLYIVMEYLEGVTLLPLLRRSSRLMTPLPLGMIGGIIQQTSEALHYAHELRDRGGVALNIIHRDVSPSNVFITQNGVVKVLDFGIAKVRNASAETSTGIVKGKYAYMAPEQLRAQAIDRRVDVFALGIVLYELLALRRLFQRQTDYLTFRAVLERPIPDLQQYRPDAPPALIDVVMSAMHREPAKRFDTVRAFSTAAVSAMGPEHRVWTQSEIADYVHANFADDLKRLSVAIHDAMQANERKKAPPAMPILTDAHGADDVFSSVDAPDAGSSQDRMPTEVEFAGETPQPFEPDKPAPTPVPAKEPSNPIPVVTKPRPSGPIARPAVPTLEPKEREPDTNPLARSKARSIPPPVVHPSAPSRSRGLQIAVGVVALALIALGGVWWFVWRPPEARVPIASAKPVSSPAGTLTDDAAPATAKHVHLSVTSKPTRARVVVDGESLGTTPLEIDVAPRSTAMFDVVADGYADHHESISLDTDLTLQVLLDKAAVPAVRSIPPPV